MVCQFNLGHLLASHAICRHQMGPKTVEAKPLINFVHLKNKLGLYPQWGLFDALLNLLDPIQKAEFRYSA